MPAQDMGMQGILSVSEKDPDSLLKIQPTWLLQRKIDLSLFQKYEESNEVATGGMEQL